MSDKRYESAARQYSTHFLTSFTASDPSGTLYSSSIEAGNVHLFFLTSWRMSLIGVSPVPHARLRLQLAGVGPVLQVVARDAAVVLVQEVQRRAAAVAARDEVAEIDVRHVRRRDRERLSNAVMLPCACVWYATLIFFLTPHSPSRLSVAIAFGPLGSSSVM